MKPKLEYDAAANAAYIRFSTEPIQRTEEVSEGIVLDYDRDGRIVGLEVLNARANLPAAALEDAAKPTLPRPFSSEPLNATVSPIRGT